MKTRTINHNYRYWTDTIINISSRLKVYTVNWRVTFESSMELRCTTSILQLTCSHGGKQSRLPSYYNNRSPPSTADPGPVQQSHCSQADLAARVTSWVTRSHGDCDWLLVAGPKSDTELFINRRRLVAAPCVTLPSQLHIL